MNLFDSGFVVKTIVVSSQTVAVAVPAQNFHRHEREETVQVQDFAQRFPSLRRVLRARSRKPSASPGDHRDQHRSFASSVP